MLHCARAFPIACATDAIQTGQVRFGEPAELRLSAGGGWSDPLDGDMDMRLASVPAAGWFVRR